MVARMTSAIGAVAVLGALCVPAGALCPGDPVFGGGYGEACWRAAVTSTFLHMDSATMEAAGRPTPSPPATTPCPAR